MKKLEGVGADDSKTLEASSIVVAICDLTIDFNSPHPDIVPYALAGGQRTTRGAVCRFGACLGFVGLNDGTNLQRMILYE